METIVLDCFENGKLPLRKWQIIETIEDSPSNASRQV